MNRVAMSCDDCAICLEHVSSAACHLACGHVFHSSCLIQSAMHDPRCPICRTVLAKKPEPATSTQIVNVEFSLNDINDAVDQEYHNHRRQQLNYDARKRRFLRNRPDLIRERDAIKAGEADLRDLDKRISAQWSRETHAMWMGPSFAPMKKERTLLLRRLRRRERIVEDAVEAELGERPEINDDDDSSLFRVIARIGRNHLLDQISNNDSPGEE